jgi:hypothetical protein
MEKIINYFENLLSPYKGKVIKRIYYVDYNYEDCDTDIYKPFIYFIIFRDSTTFLEVIGDFDGDHIKVVNDNLSNLRKKFKENNFPNQPDLWHIFQLDLIKNFKSIQGEKIVNFQIAFEKSSLENLSQDDEINKDLLIYLSIQFNNNKITFFESLGVDITEKNENSIPLVNLIDKGNLIKMNV